MYTKHWFSRESLGRMLSSVHLHTTSSGARLPFWRRKTYWRAVGSDGLRVVCNRLYFQGGNREFDYLVGATAEEIHSKMITAATTAVVRRWWESLTLPVHNIGQCRLSRDEFVVCYRAYATELSNMRSWSFRQSKCLDRMAFRRQESSVILRDCEKRLHGASDLFRSQEAERILLYETVNSCWQWFRSKHHVRVPKRGWYYLVNNSVRSRNHAMTETLNLGAVGII